MPQIINNNNNGFV